VATLGDTVRRRRREAEWTQEELARATGLKRAYISEIENGLATPSLDAIRKLADALRLSAADLLIAGGYLKESEVKRTVPRRPLEGEPEPINPLERRLRREIEQLDDAGLRALIQVAYFMRTRGRPTEESAAPETPEANGSTPEPDPVPLAR
jgi:transcriptional regulator with XRE-family HTH domain